MRRGLLRWLNAAFAAAACLLAALYLWSHRGEVARLVAEAESTVLAAALLVLASFVLLQSVLAAALLRATGADAPFADLVRAVLFSWLGKYVPGKAWTYALRLGALTGRGASPESVIAGSVAEQVFALCAGALVVLSAGLGAERLPREAAWAAALLALAGAAAFVAAPRAVHALLDRLLRALGRPPLARWPGRLPACGFLLGYAATWCWVGFGVFLLARSLAPALPASAWWPLTGAFALSVCAGFLALFAPAGIGVREAVLVLGLQAWLDPVEAVFVAVAARLLATVAELLVIGGAHLVGRRAGAAGG